MPGTQEVLGKREQTTECLRGGLDAGAKCGSRAKAVTGTRGGREANVGWREQTGFEGEGLGWCSVWGWLRSGPGGPIGAGRGGPEPFPLPVLPVKTQRGLPGRPKILQDDTGPAGPVELRPC